MKQVLLLCGGQSSEHEVSLQSAVSVLKNLSSEHYHIIPVGITKTGTWIMAEPLILNPENPSTICLNPKYSSVELKNQSIAKQKVDVVFSVLHGSYGENGCMQGWLEMQHIPFVGSKLLSSAVGMDKDITKRLVNYAGLLTAKNITLYHNQKIPLYEEIVATLGPIFFIKPCNAGSSIGITKCYSQEQYHEALALAFQHDKKIMIEEYIQGREIEIAAMGNDHVEVTLPGEIIPGDDFYSYHAKYFDKKSIVKVPADLFPDTIEKLQIITKQIYQILECRGFARIDFFLTEDQKIYFNEINTLPGFTEISMYPTLWINSGKSYSDLLHNLIELALEES